MDKNLTIENFVKVWEEKNLIEPEKKLESNGISDLNDIMINTEKNVTKNQWKDTGRKKKISGIYKIINRINGKYYVGSSNNIIKRWNEHKLNLNCYRHTNNHLQSSWNKYGKNSFDFLILEKNVSNDKLLEVEQKYLDVAKNEIEKTYNIGFISGRIEMTNEVKEKIRKSKIGKHISKETKEKLRLLKLNIKGKEHPKYDFTIYSFFNIQTNETFTGTPYDFRTKYNLYASCVSLLIHKKVKSTSGWMLSQTTKMSNGFDLRRYL